jgi:hypothetical protein
MQLQFLCAPVSLKGGIIVSRASDSVPQPVKVCRLTQLLPDQIPCTMNVVCRRSTKSSKNEC